jgi:soluble lytic murein transglycosylase-like protein
MATKRKRRTGGRRRRLVLLVLVAAGVLMPAFYVEQRPRPRSVAASLDFWARRYHVDVHLVRAVAWVESGNQPDVVSPTGARGVMQVQPATWRWTETLIGHRVSPSADGNVQIGVAYLHNLLREFHGDRRLALAAYYQGPAAVRRDGVYRSAERYVRNVLALSSRL